MSLLLATKNSLYITKPSTFYKVNQKQLDMTNTLKD